MDRSVHLFLLNALAVAGLACASAASAESADGVGVTADNPQVVDPRVERRDINVAGIDKTCSAEIRRILLELAADERAFGFTIASDVTAQRIKTVDAGSDDLLRKKRMMTGSRT